MELVRSNVYYRLVHSFRKNGRVVTRSEYVGKSIPENIEERKERLLRKCFREDAFKKVDLIRKNFLKEWKTFPESVKKNIVLSLSARFTYNTNAIEGSTITLEETEDLVERNLAPHKNIRDVQETMNHAKLFLEVLNEKRGLSLPLLLEWHDRLFHDSKQDIAGQLRDYHVRVGSYRAPDWQDVERLLKEFIEWFNRNERVLHPVELSARAHYKFEKIHPFGDGNGRVGRLIIAYALSRARCASMIIEYKKRKSYYHALEKTENNFVNYFVQGYIRVHKKYLEKS